MAKLLGAVPSQYIVLAVYWAVFGVSILAAIYFHIRVPHAGAAIIFLAIPPVMFILKDRMAEPEKVLWVLVTFSLVAVEVRAIERDARENAATFRSIADGIQESNKLNQKHFDETIQKTQMVVTGLGENINTITGGDSFAVLYVFQPTDTGTGLAVAQHGKYAVFNVEARIVNLYQFQSLAKAGALNLQSLGRTQQNMEIGELAPTMGKLMTGKIPFDPMKDIQQFNIFFSARNGTWTELLRLKKLDGKWLAAIRVLRDTTQAVIFEQIDKGYGHVDWDEKQP